MCLIVVAQGLRPDFPFILAANRDEYFARPTSAAAFWDGAPQILAGRDLEQGGTWLGVTRAGRLAAVTNFRDGHGVRRGVKSRGWLVRDFLMADLSADRFLEEVDARHDDYDGFNLLVGSTHGLHYYSNHTRSTVALGPGIHGLSNHLLNTPWPKVERAKTRLHVLAAAAPGSLIADLFSLLADDARAPDDALPDTGIPRERERVLSSAFIRTPDYGTRASTVLLGAPSGLIQFEERTFSPQGEIAERRSYVLSTS
jgi:uncharacterized protein with NRDE domain